MQAFVNSTQFTPLKTSNENNSIDNKKQTNPRDSSQDFWLKNDFLNLQLFVSEKMLRAYYLAFYATVLLFILIMMALLFPVDWSDNSRLHVLMYKIDYWIKSNNVFSKEQKDK